MYSKFTKDHEWIEYDKDTKVKLFSFIMLFQIGKIGITKYAQGELGDIVHVDIKEVGHHFTRGEGIVSALY